MDIVIVCTVVSTAERLGTMRAARASTNTASVSEKPGTGRSDPTCCPPTQIGRSAAAPALHPISSGAAPGRAETLHCRGAPFRLS